MQTATNLAWTGERFIPGVAGEIAVEHLHRYALACQLAQDKRVLDIACGEGYGSRLLAERAASVVGIDIDGETVGHAKAKYGQENLEFQQASCTSLPLPNASIDLAVSFETLEHHADHEAMLAELCRVLTPDGILLISTPDRFYYSDARNYANPFHVRELYAKDFQSLILRHFPNVALYGQRMTFGSLTAPINGRVPFVTYTGDSARLIQQEGLQGPLYLIAVASASALPVLPASIFDGTHNWQEERQKLLIDLAEAKDQLARTKLQLGAVYGSIYWRLTSPLRRLRKIIKLVFGV